MNVFGDITSSSNLSIQGVSTFGSNAFFIGNTGFSSNVLIQGSTSLTNNLEVQGSTYLTSNLNVFGDVSLLSNISVQGASTFGSNVLFLESSEFRSNLTIYGGIDIRSNLNVTGDMLINNVSLSNFITETLNNLSNLNVNGTSTFGSNVFFIGNADFSSNVIIQGSTSLASNLNVYGDIFSASNLSIQGVSTFGSNAFFLGNTGFSSNVFIQGSTSLTSNLNVYGDVSLSSNLKVEGVSTFGSNVVFLQNSEFRSNVNLSGDLLINNVSLSNFMNETLRNFSNLNYNNTSSNIGSNVFFIGNTTFSSNVIIQGSTSLSSNLNVIGTSTFGSNVFFIGTTAFSSNVIIQGSASLSSNLNVFGDVLLSSNLFVQGISTFGSNALFLGDARFSNNVLIQGSTSLSSNVLVQGIGTFGSNINVLGDTSLSSNLSVQGVSTFGSNTLFLQNSEFRSNLIIYGGVDIRSNLNLSGDILINNVSLSNFMTETLKNLSNLNVSGSSTFGSNVFFIGNTQFSSNVTIQGSTSLSSNLNVTGTSTFGSNVFFIGTTAFSSNVIIQGSTSLSSNLNVTGTSTFGSNVFFIGTTAFSSNVIIQGSTSLSSNLNVNGTSTFGSNALFLQNSEFRSNLTIYGGLNISSNLNLSGDMLINNVSLSNFMKETLKSLSNIASNVPIYRSNIWSNVTCVGKTTFCNDIHLNCSKTIYNGHHTHCNDYEILYTGCGKVNFDQCVTIKNLKVKDKISVSNIEFQGGILSFGMDTSNVKVWSNIPDTEYGQVHSSFVVDSNLYVGCNLYLGGKLYCNGFSMFNSTDAELGNLVVYKSVTLCNTSIDGVLKLGNSNKPLIVYSNITDSNPQEVGTLVVDSNLYVGGMIYCNGLEWTKKHNQYLNDTILCGKTTFCNWNVEGIIQFGNSGQYAAFSNIPNSNISTFESTVVIDEDLYVRGKLFCNGFSMTAVGSGIGNGNVSISNLVVYDSVTLCNTSIEGVLKLGNSCKPLIVYSNIPDSNPEEVGTLVVDSNLYVGGMIYCNGLEWTTRNNQHLHDTFIYGKTTFCNWNVVGKIEFGNCGEYTTFSNIPNSNISTFETAVVIDEDLYVRGRIFCNGFSLTAVGSNCGVYNSNISPSNQFTYLNVSNYFRSSAPVNIFDSNLRLMENLLFYKNNACTSNTPPSWTIGLKNSCRCDAQDFIFKSKNGTTITFTDNFTSEILNFTGKHRCSSSELNYENINDHIGKIVVASGQYKGLDGTTEIMIDEAIPIVKLAYKANDKRVFGVICGTEENSKSRQYKMGNLQFEHEKQDSDVKVIINSVGEGAILVCNINGTIENGDLITSSEIPGYGMKQNSDIIRSCTVAKITCDCDFEDSEEFMYNGKKLKRKLVGCIYKC